MRTIATAEINGTYGPEHVRVYTNTGRDFRFVAPGWRPMNADSAMTACRKVASHPRFVRFMES